MPDRNMEQVERVARAIYEDCYPSLRWSDAIKDPRMEDVVRMCFSNARAALAAAPSHDWRDAWDEYRDEVLNGDGDPDSINETLGHIDNLRDLVDPDAPCSHASEEPGRCLDVDVSTPALADGRFGGVVGEPERCPEPRLMAKDDGLWLHLRSGNRDALINLWSREENPSRGIVDHVLSDTYIALRNDPSGRDGEKGVE
jgi:hypothetical protein